MRQRLRTWFDWATSEDVTSLRGEIHKLQAILDEIADRLMAVTRPLEAEPTGRPAPRRRYVPMPQREPFRHPGIDTEDQYTIDDMERGE